MVFLGLVATAPSRRARPERASRGVHTGRLSDVLAGRPPALREPALGHGDQALPGRRHLPEQRQAGHLPQVEQSASAHLVQRAAGAVRALAAADDDPQRAAHGMGVAPARGDRGQEPPVRPRRGVLRTAGPPLHRGRRGDPDRSLCLDVQLGGAGAARRPRPPRKRLHDRHAGGRCQPRDGGTRQLDHPLDPRPRRRGSGGDLGGRPGAIRRPLHRAEARFERLPVRASILAPGDAEPPDAGGPGVLSAGPAHGRGRMVGGHLHLRRRSTACQPVLRSGATPGDRLAHGALRVRHGLGHHRPDLRGGLSPHPLHFRIAGVVSDARAQGRSPPVPGEEAEPDPAPVDLDRRRAVPARPRRRPLHPRRRLGV